MDKQGIKKAFFALACLRSQRPFASTVPQLTNPTMLTPIPLPADDYDRCHTSYAALSSLHAATASFDATIDSLLSTTKQHERRVQSLELRVKRCREWIAQLKVLSQKKAEDTFEGNVDDLVCIVYSPATYEEAIKGIELNLFQLRGEISGGDGEGASLPSSLLQNDDYYSRILQTSASDEARSAANSAVRKALVHDAQTDDGEAIPSDAWLDQASTGIVGLSRSLKVAESQRRVPSLLGSLKGSTATGEIDSSYINELEYRGMLDSLSLNASSSSANIPGSLASLANFGEGGTGGDDDESVHSRMSALSVSSNVSASGRMTAGQRKRWHQQQKQLRIIKAGGTVQEGDDDMRTTSDTLGTSLASPPTKAAANRSTSLSTPHSSVAARSQQSSTGSHPFLCEVLHDSFGIGNEPPRGLVDCSGYSARGTREGGTEFPTPSSVGDLVVFNTTRDSYGLAKRRATAMAKDVTTISFGREGANRM